MKRLTAILLTLALALGVLSIAAAAGDVFDCGDVNGDGSINNLDAVAILKHDAGIAELDADGLFAADVNFDDAVNNVDASIVLQHDAGIISIGAGFADNTVNIDNIDERVEELVSQFYDEDGYIENDKKKLNEASDKVYEMLKN